MQCAPGVLCMIHLTRTSPCGLRSELSVAVQFSECCKAVQCAILKVTMCKRNMPYDASEVCMAPWSSFCDRQADSYTVHMLHHRQHRGMHSWLTCCSFNRVAARGFCTAAAAAAHLVHAGVTTIMYAYYRTDACQPFSQAAVCWLDHCCIQVRRQT